MTRCSPSASCFIVSGNLVLLMSGIGSNVPASTPDSPFEQRSRGPTMSSAAADEKMAHLACHWIVDHLMNAISVGSSTKGSPSSRTAAPSDRRR